MQIAFITPSFPLTDESSSGVFVERLAFHVATDVDLQVVTPATDQADSVSAPVPYTVRTFRYAPWKWQLIAQQPGGIPVAFKQNKWLIFLLPFFLISLFSATVRAARKSDLIHANWAITGAIAGLAGKLTRTAVITTLRGSDITRSENSWIDRQILIFCLKTSQKVIAVCPPLMKSVTKGYPWASDKVVSISNGVDEVFLAIDKQHTNVDNFRIISVGSLIPRKNMDTIVRAVAILKNEFDITLEIVGGGLEYDRLVQLGNDLDLGMKLIMTDNIPAKEVPAHLALADVFVLASYSEGRPNVVMEALAAGVPVIASNIEGVTDIIDNDHNGLIFQPDDHDALALAIRRLLKDSSMRQKYAHEGRKYILENKLNWSGSAKQYMNVYNEILNT